MSPEIMPVDSSYSFLRKAVDVHWSAQKLLLFVIFKWKRLILSLLLVFTVGATVAMWLKPPVHQANAKILLKVDRTPLQISGLTSLAGRLPYSLQVLQSEVELIKSRDVLLPVAQATLQKRKQRPESSRRPESVQAEDLEVMLASLGKNIVPVAVPDTNIIQVSYFARTPKEAQEVLGAIVEEYMGLRAIANSGSTKLTKFYEQERERVAANLWTAEQALRKWQEANKVVSIDLQINRQLETLGTLETTLQQTEAQIGGTRAKLVTLQNQLNAQPKQVVMSRDDMGHERIPRLRKELAAATREPERFGRERIRYLELQLATAEQEAETRGREVTGLNPVRKTLEEQIAVTEASMTSLVSQKQTLRNQIQEASAVLAALREKKVEFNPLAREVDVQKATSLLYEKKLEEARIASRMDEEELSAVTMIERPHALPGTDSLKRILMVLLAAVGGSVLGLVFASGIEFFNNSLRTEEDVEHYLALPVLAVIRDSGENRALPLNA